MNVKNITDQLVDCAIYMALYTLPGAIDTDKNMRAAYRSLAEELIVTKRQQLSYLLPRIKTALIPEKLILRSQNT